MSTMDLTAQGRALSSRGTLRGRILTFVAALILLSLFGSTLSLYRITEVNRSLNGITRVLVPLGRLLVQLQADSEVFRHEVDRRLGQAHWGEPHWRPRPVPPWMTDVISSELARAQELVSKPLPPEIEPSGSVEHWRSWLSEVSRGFAELQDGAARTHSALEQGNLDAASRSHSRLVAGIDEWARQVQWGAAEYDRSLRHAFSEAQSRVSQLRTGLEVVLIVVVCFSLLLLWLGERALRPLVELTALAREIARRGLRKEDKAPLREIPLTRDDEVSQLAREFHRMATALLEREKTVEMQNARLQEQNHRLREMADLQERLQRAEQLAAVGRMSAQVAHEVRNPLHAIGLEAEMAAELAARQQDPALKQSIASILAAVDRLEKITDNYLKLSRLSSGRKSRLDLGQVLESVLATYAADCERASLRVEWSRERGANLKVEGDAELLEQALGNLLRNSVQALVASGTKEPAIRWKLGAAESGRVWVRIEDNGPGVSPEVREKLFEPFVTTKAEGTGLGLSFVKKVAAEHGGDIRYLHDAGRAGACFELVLPQANTGAEAAEPRQGEGATLNG